MFVKKDYILTIYYFTFSLSYLNTIKVCIFVTMEIKGKLITNSMNQTDTNSNTTSRLKPANSKKNISILKQKLPLIGLNEHDV